MNEIPITSAERQLTSSARFILVTTPAQVETAIGVACSNLGVSRDQIFARLRSTPTVSLARWAVWCWCHRRGFSYSDIARLFGREHTTIRYGVRTMSKHAAKYPEIDELLKSMDKTI